MGVGVAVMTRWVLALMLRGLELLPLVLHRATDIYQPTRTEGAGFAGGVVDQETCQPRCNGCNSLLSILSNGYKFESAVFSVLVPPIPCLANHNPDK